QFRARPTGGEFPLSAVALGIGRDSPRTSRVPVSGISRRVWSKRRRVCARRSVRVGTCVSRERGSVDCRRRARRRIQRSSAFLEGFQAPDGDVTAAVSNQYAQLTPLPRINSVATGGQWV